MAVMAEMQPGLCPMAMINKAIKLIPISHLCIYQRKIELSEIFFLNYSIFLAKSVFDVHNHLPLADLIDKNFLTACLDCRTYNLAV